MTASSSSVLSTLESFLYDMYLSLMEAGHSMADIDNMDMLFYIKMINHKEQKEMKKKMKNMDSAGV